MTRLAAAQVSLADRVVDASLAVRPSELLAVVGPNGSGKSTLLKLLAGQISPDQGTVQLDEKRVSDWPPRDRARRLGYLPQHPEVAWPIRVADMVALGRFAYGGPLFAARPAEHAIIGAALARVGMADFATRSTATLSGGELALAALARVLATDAPLLLLDEPTASLDPQRQLMAMRLLRDVVSEGIGVAIVLHDLNLAAQFADRIIWMNKGRLVAQTGTSAAELQPIIRTVFAVEPHFHTGVGTQSSAISIRPIDD